MAEPYDFKGKRVTVVGLGIEGIDLVRFLHAQGARITVSDAKPAEKLRARLEQIADVPARLSLGANDPHDLMAADAIFLSQGVPLDLPGLAEARQQGIPISSMFKLFLELCPGLVAGITGSSGKTTTTALVGEMFRCDGRPHFVGGNIGIGLLSHLPALTPETWVVLEVSHTQLQLLPERSPNVACLLNITPNHLDRFSWDEYRRLKASILHYQQNDDYAILGYDDREARALADQTRGQVLYFSLASDIPSDGAFLREGWVIFRRQGREERLFPIESLRLRGRHNWANAVAAAAVASACGLGPQAIARAADEFQAQPHRLEFVRELAGVAYYNDSIATTPERTLAALRSFSQSLLLLLGGREKHLPLEELAAEACRRCRAVIFFGESAPLLEEAVQQAAEGLPTADRPTLRRVTSLAEAVHAAHDLAQPGDVVLLSPACTSFDAYDNFEERGIDFRRLVLQLAQEVKPSPR
ncbi:MAG: UDP-N-acetylmuramoyl-L-alanine--D-glutamate ligase [Dehalococcoidia bacterium]